MLECVLDMGRNGWFSTLRGGAKEGEGMENLPRGKIWADQESKEGKWEHVYASLVFFFLQKALH